MRSNPTTESGFEATPPDQVIVVPSSYRELFRLQALPGAYRGVVAIVLALSPRLLGAWFATRSGRWDLFEKSGSLTGAVGLLWASRQYIGHGVLELAILRKNKESGMAHLTEDIHAAKLGLALSAFGLIVGGWGKYLGWWSFSLLLVWAATAAIDAWHDFIHLRGIPIGVPPAEVSINAAGADADRSTPQP